LKTALLDELARSLTGPFAFCGIAVARGGMTHFAIGQQPFLDADAQSPFRVASVSKVLVGRALAAFVMTKATTWDADISDLLGWRLRHPAQPDTRLTLAMVAAHHAGLDDAAGYLIPPDLTLQQWCQTQDIFGYPPGVHFAYANLGYIILAEVLERLSGNPFPQAMSPFLPKGSGFNWVGVTPADRAKALPTYRRADDSYVAQIDAPPVLPATARHAGQYSPQGGLRTSLSGMLDIAKGLKDGQLPPLWTPSMGSGGYVDGVFESYGAGVQVFDNPSFYDHPLVGHFGNAYGFNGGVWYDRARDMSFAYALNGLEMGDESDAFSDAEIRIFDAIAQT
jgi:CubicO group peptidase (beta-lactamase class C family)